MSEQGRAMSEEQQHGRHNGEQGKQDHPWGELNEHYHGEGPLPKARPVRRRTLWTIVIVVVLVAAIILIWGIVSRRRHNDKLKTDTAAIAAPTVTVTHPQPSAPAQEIVLPSNIQAFMDAPIYARTSGYVKSWFFDIGSHVKRGQLMAVIESPEVDQQLSQAKADLQTTLANAHLANVTATRYVDLLKSDSVSKQDTDNAVQNAAAQNSNVKAQQANVDRLQQLVDFEKVRAPFDGIVTQRNTDVGQLINAGNGGSAQELFHEQDIHRLRVFISVPQTYALDARPGLPAYITLDEYPQQKFWGVVVRTANSIDVASRTLNVEVDLDNPKGTLLAGAYAAVHLPVHSAQNTYVIPVSALMFRSEGLRVATVIDDRGSNQEPNRGEKSDGDNNGRNNENQGTPGKVKMVPIVPGRDFGTQIEVISGLKPSDQVITNPPDSAVDGGAVRIVQPANAPNGSPQQGNGGGQGKQGGAADSGQEKGAGLQGTRANTGNSQGTQQGQGSGQQGQQH